MSIVRANKSVTISKDLYNDVCSVLAGLNVQGADLFLSRRALDGLQAAVTTQMANDCVEVRGARGGSVGLCQTHNYLPIEYYTDAQGKLLVRGTFDPDGTRYPVCPAAHKYDGGLAAAYHR